MKRISIKRKTKSKMLTFVFGLSFLWTSGQNAFYDTIQYAREYHQERLAIFSREPIQNNKIIFLGNSISEFGDWKILINDTTVINRGIAGDNTFGVLARLEDVIVRQPSKLFIEIGINDISQNIPVSIILNNISQIIDRVKLRSPKTEIYVVSILPTNDNVKKKYPAAFNKNHIVNLVNEQLKKRARKNRFLYVDLGSKLSDENGKLDVKYAKPDGIHLNEIGYQVWIRLLKEKKFL